MRHIRMDVHRDFCEVAVWEEGRVRSGAQGGRDPEDLEVFAQSLGPRDEVALEATTNSLATRSLPGK